MQIKESERQSWIVVSTRTLWRRRGSRVVGACLGFLAMLAAATFGIARVYENRVLVYTRILKPAAQWIKSEPQRIPQHWAYGLLAKPEQITIDMNHRAFMKLAYQREVALAKGYLDVGDSAFVPATIRYGADTVKADVRLKGDWTDHLRGEKWSLRIKIKGGRTLLGMSQFSIQHPGTRAYIYEWIFHQALQREGVLPLRYDFIRVTINGKDLGVYALEEHFEKRLLEHFQRLEGPIVRFNESLLWAERFQQVRRFPESEHNGTGAYLASWIDGFQEKRMLGDPHSAALYQKAIHLLESFRRGELATSEVFDTEKLARYFAIADLLGARHATMWQNVRFYYNPITSRLEPIGFDANAGKPLMALSATLGGVDIGHEERILDNLRAPFFHDPAFHEEYIKTLERISQPSYLDRMFADLDGDLQAKLRIIYSEYPAYRFEKETLYRNQRYIASVLDPVKGLHAYLGRANGGMVSLDLGCIHSLPMEVLGVSCGTTKLRGPAEKVILPAKLSGEPVHYRPEAYTLPAGVVWSDSMRAMLTVQYRLLGGSRAREESVFPWSYLGELSPKDDFMRQPPNSEEWQFLRMDEKRREIAIRPGSWTVNRNVVIPKGYTVVCGGGVELNLVNAACILSYSPLDLEGTEENPIEIVSRDGTGQGLVVMSAGRPSVLEHVTFRGLSNPSQGGWTLTGAVTFYESPLRAGRCRFIDNRCEDALNTKRTSFEVDESLFSGTQSDAFDADFCRGTMNDVSFVDVGNDGVDVSGSEVALKGIRVERAGDKGVSAGEGSHMSVDGLEVMDSEIGMASKDRSLLEVRNATIVGCKIGVTTFQKKPEFGPASIKAEAVKMSRVKIHYLIERGSDARVDGGRMEGTREHVESILYGVEYGKASR